MHFPLLVATTEERGENVSIGMAQTLQWPERPATVTGEGGAALAAAGGGAHRAAHAQLGGGLGLRLRVGFGFRFWFGLRCVVVRGSGFRLPVPVSAGVVAPGL